MAVEVSGGQRDIQSVGENSAAVLVPMTISNDELFQICLELLQSYITVNTLLIILLWLSSTEKKIQINMDKWFLIACLTNVGNFIIKWRWQEML